MKHENNRMESKQNILRFLHSEMERYENELQNKENGHYNHQYCWSVVTDAIRTVKSAKKQVNEALESKITFNDAFQICKIAQSEYVLAKEEIKKLNITK